MLQSPDAVHICYIRCIIQPVQIAYQEHAKPFLEKYNYNYALLVLTVTTLGHLEFFQTLLVSVITVLFDDVLTP